MGCEPAVGPSANESHVDRVGEPFGNPLKMLSERTNLVFRKHDRMWLAEAPFPEAFIEGGYQQVKLVRSRLNVDRKKLEKERRMKYWKKKDAYQ